MNKRVYRKVIKRVLANQTKATNEGYKYTRTKLERKAWVVFSRHCEKVLQPIVDEILAEEKARNETIKT